MNGRSPLTLDEAVLLDHVDAATKRRADAMCQAVREDPNAWEFCLTRALDHTDEMDPRVRFFCLNVVLDRLRDNGPFGGTLSAQQRGAIKTAVLAWFVDDIPPSLPSYLANKYSDLITALFLSQYPSGAWPSFFGDLIGTLSVSVAHVDMFVRVCDAIQTGILARNTPVANDVKNDIKDMMRDTCIERLAGIWEGVLFEALDHGCFDLAANTLAVVAEYADWIDIGLVANQTMVPLVWECLAVGGDVRVAACAVFSALINKGMDDETKMDLLDALDVMGALSQIEFEEGDTDGAAAAGTVLADQARVLLGLYGGGGTVADRALVLVEASMPGLLALLNHQEPEVVTRVADAVFSYVSAMAKGGPPSEAQANTLASLLTTLADQMQLRAAGSGASGGEGGFYAVGGAGDGGPGFGGSDDPLMACLEDDEFDRFRFTLAKIFKTVGRWAGVLAVDFVAALFDHASEDGSPAVVEIALYLLGQLAEVQLPNRAYEDMGELACAVFGSDLHACDSSVVRLAYFGVISRLHKVIRKHSAALPLLLHHLLAALDADDAAVRDTAAKTFLKTAKRLNKLVVKCMDWERFSEYVPAVSAAPHIVSEDTQSVFETLGLIARQCPRSVDQQDAIECLLAPVCRSIFGLVGGGDANGGGDDGGGNNHGPFEAACLNSYIQAATAVSKAFTSIPSAPHLTEPLVTAAQAVLGAWDRVERAEGASESDREAVTSSTFSFLHTILLPVGADDMSDLMTALLGAEPANQTPFVTGYLGLLSQLVTGYRDAVAPFVASIYPAVLERVFGLGGDVWAETCAGAASAHRPVTDADHETRFLVVAYFRLVRTLVATCPATATIVTGCELATVLSTILTGCKHPDLDVAKAAVGLLRVVSAELDWSDQSLCAFLECAMETALELALSCAGAPVASGGDQRGVVGELAALQRVLAEVCGDSVLAVLGELLPQLACEPRLVTAYVRSLIEDDDSDFTAFFEDFCRDRCVSLAGDGGHGSGVRRAMTTATA